MSTKSEWTAVHEGMMEEQRQRLGPPPTVEEIEAYENGQLSAEDEERVRALLVCYPDLARTLVRHDQPDAPRPGDADFLSQDQLTKDWKALQERIHGREPSGRVLRFWRISAAIAATLAVIFGGLLWRARSELGQPVIAYEYVLSSDAVRGTADQVTTVSPDGEHVLLTIVKDGAPGFDQYRVDILRSASTPSRRVWSGRARPSPDHRYVSIVVPTRFLDAGSYEVELFGVRDGREERLATYPFRVER